MKLNEYFWKLNYYRKTYSNFKNNITVGDHCIQAIIFLRSNTTTVTKQIILEIDISEFFELNSFLFEDKEKENLLPDLKFRKLLMSGEIEEEMIGFCNQGGRNYINLNILIFF